MSINLASCIAEHKVDDVECSIPDINGVQRGYIGMVERMFPAKPITGSAYNRARTVPRTLEAALDRFSSCKPVRNLLGEDFFDIYFAVKDYELFNDQSVVSSWEREHLLLRV